MNEINGVKSLSIKIEYEKDDMTEIYARVYSDFWMKNKGLSIAYAVFSLCFAFFEWSTGLSLSTCEFWTSLVLVLCPYLVFQILVLIRITGRLRKALLNQSFDFVISGGYLIRQDQHSSMRCVDFDRIIQSKHFIFLFIDVTKIQSRLIPIPKRVFHGEQEMLQFLDMLKETPDEECVIEGIQKDIDTPHISLGWDVNAEQRAHEISVGAFYIDRLHGTVMKSNQVKILLSAIIMILGFLDILLRWGSKGMISGILLMLFGMYTLWLTMIFPFSEENLLKTFRQKKQKVFGIGHWNITFTESKMKLKTEVTEAYCELSQIEDYFLTEDTYYLFADKGKTICGLKYVAIPFRAFVSEDVRCKLLDFWHSHEILPREITEKCSVTNKTIRKVFCVWIKWILLAFCLGSLCFHFVNIVSRDFFRDSLVMESEDEDRMYYEGDYEFDPMEYEEYVSLEKQVKQLETLGVHITEDTIDNCREMFKIDPVNHVFVEGMPYTYLLYTSGCGEWNNISEKYEQISKEVYAFDMEAMDISEEYITILNGIQEIGEGDFIFTDGKEDTSKVDMENGTGKIMITYQCNGVPCEYEAKMQYDWVDPGFIVTVSEQLEKQIPDKKLYYLFDDQQGMIVFWRDAAWGKQFLEVIGLEFANRDTFGQDTH